MDVRDLEVFLSVATHLSFTRAGEKVHLSQPSISLRIHEMNRRVEARRRLVFCEGQVSDDPLLFQLPPVVVNLGAVLYTPCSRFTLREHHITHAYRS